jgi:hypothetical protein
LAAEKLTDVYRITGSVTLFFRSRRRRAVPPAAESCSGHGIIVLSQLKKP